MKIEDIIRELINRNIGTRRFNHFIQSYDYKKYTRNNDFEIKLINENKKFKGIHAGERCFILGNGPSLKNHDLSLLENEIVFTCNQIARNSEFNKIKTNYHFWADPIFFDLDENKPEDMELLATMKNVVTDDNNPQCFFTMDSYNFVKKYNLDNELKISYFKPALSFCDKFDMDMDFSKFVPGFHTVVQYAVAMAIYMGFKDIYILGSEITGILTSINIRLQNNLKDDYAYEISKNEKKRMMNRVDTVTFEQELNSFLNIFRDYRRLNEYCFSRNIKLINCTPGGLIESLPRMEFESILVSRGNNDV